MEDPLGLSEQKGKTASKVDGNSHIPLYSQIAGLLLTAINEGHYREGEKLPTEIELCDVYGVSRITARKAIQELALLGRVERKQGKGTFVLPPQVSMYAMAMDGFGGFAAHSSGVSTRRIISKRFDDATEKEANWLSIEPGTAIQELVRSFSLEGVPIMLDRALYSAVRYPGLVEEVREGDSTYQLLWDRFKSRASAVDKEITYTVARPEEATLLQCNIGEPLFFINKTVYGEAGQIIHHAISLVVASRVKLTFTYKR